MTPPRCSWKSSGPTVAPSATRHPTWRRAGRHLPKPGLHVPRPAGGDRVLASRQLRNDVAPFVVGARGEAARDLESTASPPWLGRACGSGGHRRTTKRQPRVRQTPHDPPWRQCRPRARVGARSCLEGASASAGRGIWMRGDGAVGWATTGEIVDRPSRRPNPMDVRLIVRTSWIRLGRGMPPIPL